VDSASAPLEFFLQTLLKPGWYEGKELDLPSHPGFATGPLKRPHLQESNSRQMLLKRQGGTWKPVGLYMDDTVVLAGEVRGRGLSTELILRCVPHRNHRERRTLTKAGEAALTKAYYVGVGRAIERGQDVASHIRKAYEEWKAT
jgi:hypothetical protein